MDYAAPGKQVGWLRVPHSVTRSAYGVVPVPVAVLNNGEGPRILLTAGNHGDEYEGQVVLTRLIQRLRAEDIRGKLIVIPSLNTPAAIAGTRVSPLDDGNLNRAFPGDPDGGPTWKIANYLQNYLVPMVECGGGLPLRRRQPRLPAARQHPFLPGCQPRTQGAQPCGGQVARPPQCDDLRNSRTRRRHVTATRKHSAIYINGEYGGTGALTAEGIRLVDGAVQRLLAFFGATDATFEPLPPPVALHVFGPRAYIYTPEAGVFVQATRLGDTVAEGDLCGELLFPENPARAPIPLYFEAAGDVVCQRHPGRVERGDCVAHLAGR